MPTNSNPPTWAGFPCRQAAKIATLRPFVQESRFPLPRQQIATGSVQSRLPAEEIQDSPAARQPLQQGNWATPADVGITWGTYYLACLILRPFIGAAIDRCNIKALLVLCFPKDDKEGNTKKAASSQRKTSVKNFINLADCGFAEREFIIKCFSHVYEWSEGQEQPSVKTKELRGEPATSCGKTNPRYLRSKNQRHTR